jgi:hypothetical protein
MDAISPLRDSEANEVKPGGENAATAIEAIGDYGAISSSRPMAVSTSSAGTSRSFCVRGTSSSQEQHDLANHLLLAPAANDALGALWADPCHLAQPVGLFGRAVTRHPRESGGISGTSAAAPSCAAAIRG